MSLTKYFRTGPVTGPSSAVLAQGSLIPFHCFTIFSTKGHNLSNHYKQYWIVYLCEEKRKW